MAVKKAAAPAAAALPRDAVRKMREHAANRRSLYGSSDYSNRMRQLEQDVIELADALLKLLPESEQ